MTIDVQIISELECITIHEGDTIRIIPIAAIASWGELLGYDDPIDALDAIIYVQINGEPEPDPTTGENAWTKPYVALAAREQARQREAIVTPDPAVDFRSPQLRGALKAAPYKPAVDEARGNSRARLGLAPGRGQNGSLTRTPAVVSALESVADKVASNRASFLRGMRPPMPNENDQQ